jgi:hypothetical protein
VGSQGGYYRLVKRHGATTGLILRSTEGKPIDRDLQRARHGELARLQVHIRKLVHHARRLVFQMAEVVVPQEMFAAILEQIGRLRRYGWGEDALVVQ